MNARPSRLPRPAPVEWLLLLLGLALVVRYRWLFDDAFVYFRTVDNLLFLKAGLVFNAGERVEGYSSPAHCLLLVALRALRLGWPALVLGLGLTSFALFWWGLVVLGRRLAPEGARAVVNAPLALLAASYSVTSFFTAGNEAPLEHLAAVGTALFLASPRSRAGALAVALSPLVRPELALSTAAAATYAWVATRRTPRLLLAVGLVANLGWLAFRALYYADLFPNTFYLKLGTRLEQGSNLDAGLRYLRDALSLNRLDVALGLGLLLALALGLRARSGRAVQVGPRAAMLACAALVGTQVVATGGSAMHYYYLAFPLTLAACALAGLAEHALGDRRAVGFALGVALAAWVASRYPGSLSRHPLTRGETMVRLPSLEVMTDPSFFRHQEPVPHQWPTVDELAAFAPHLRDEGYRGWTDSLWCNALYAAYDVRSVHPYGLTDAFLSRVEAPEAKRGHKPALAALARDLIALQMRAGSIGRGVYTDAIRDGTAPAWLAQNEATVDVVERKVFPPRGPWESLRLALRFPPRLRLPAPP